METQTEGKVKTSAKDVFLNLGAIVALYTLVVSLINLLFTAINSAYPQITNGYNYNGSGSISWPVATLIIFFPIFMVLMWLLEREYTVNPEKQSVGIHRWLSYITLFISGLLIAGDLITVLYFFIDGQELTTGFLMKIVVLLVIAVGIFSYYLVDIRGKLTSHNRRIYRIIALVVVLASIVWGFSVLGSPRTQRLYKYDEEKVTALQNINSEINSYYSDKGALPTDLHELESGNYYIQPIDSQTNNPYEYENTGKTTYNICAVFNKASMSDESKTYNYGGTSWVHDAGHFCFKESVNEFTNPNIINAKPVR